VGAQILIADSGRGLGHVTPTIFGSTVGYPSDSLASCSGLCLVCLLCVFLICLLSVFSSVKQC